MDTAIEILTYAQAARALGTSLTTIHNLISRGELHRVEIASGASRKRGEEQYGVPRGEVERLQLPADAVTVQDLAHLLGESARNVLRKSYDASGGYLTQALAIENKTPFPRFLSPLGAGIGAKRQYFRLADIYALPILNESQRNLIGAYAFAHDLEHIVTPPMPAAPADKSGEQDVKNIKPKSESKSNSRKAKGNNKRKPRGGISKKSARGRAARITARKK